MKSGIYLIINIINDKKYIGSTGSSVGFNNRWGKHKTGLKRNEHGNPHLQDAYNKYGKSNFIFSILEECSDDILVLREQHWIDHYDTMNPLKGYNLKEASRYGKISEETRKRMSLARLGKKPSKATRKKQSESHMGHTPWNKGKKSSEETKKKMSEAGIGRKGYWKGKKLPKEVIEKIRNANKGKSSPLKGRKLSLDHIKKLSESHIGLKYPDFSEEHRKKLSIAQTGKKHTEETIQKMKDNHVGNKGRKFSEEHKRRLSESVRLAKLAKL